MIEVEKFKTAITEAANTSSEKFFTWFNNDKSTEQSFITGKQEFDLEILKHEGINLHRYVALDIGYGGGRMLAEACKHFDKVIGIDIHPYTELVTSELSKRGITNFELFTTDGKSIPLQDDLVDFIYSYIVFQHLGDINILYSYISEIKRVMNPVGIAVIYVGRNDRDIRDYHQLDAEVNHTNLKIGMNFFSKYLTTTGFKIHKIITSLKYRDDGIIGVGTQYGFVISKQ